MSNPRPQFWNSRPGVPRMNCRAGGMASSILAKTSSPVMNMCLSGSVPSSAHRMRPSLTASAKGNGGYHTPSLNFLPKEDVDCGGWYRCAPRYTVGDVPRLLARNVIDAPQRVFTKRQLFHTRLILGGFVIFSSLSVSLSNSILPTSSGTSAVTSSALIFLRGFKAART